VAFELADIVVFFGIENTAVKSLGATYSLTYIL
jgi:hypothetical protein